MKLSILSLSVLLPSVLGYGGQQIPMADVDAGYTPQVNQKPTLADLLTIEGSASIFYAYARELELSQGLSQKDMKMTLFVPTNKAVMNLAHKPHQGSQLDDQGIKISEQEYDQVARKNVERWVSGHIVLGAPISLVGEQQTLLPSKSITFNRVSKSQGPEWSQVTLEDGIHILSKKEASNGDLYMIDGTIVSDASQLD